MDNELPDVSKLPSRAAEMQYFLAHREEWSREHPRAWVAVVGTQIVGLADDLRDAMRQARTAGHDHPFVGRLQDPELLDAAFIGAH